MTTATTPTRDRLLDAAVELFAKHGYTETTVGDIEEAAGLVPRAGAMYKHFTSKEALLHAALDRFVSSTAVVNSHVLDLVPLGDMRAEATLLAHTTMAHFKAQKDFLQIAFQERARIPGVVEEMYRGAVAPAYEIATRWVQRQMDAGFIGPCDAEAIGALLVTPFVAYRLELNLFGVPPGGVTEDRFVAGWVDLLMTYAKGSKGDIDANT